MRRLAVVGIAACTLATVSAAAQQAPAPPNAPPGVPPGGPGGGALPPAIVMVKPLTEAQKLVASLPPPQQGVGGPANLLPDAPKPSADPRDFQGGWNHDTPLVFRMQHDMYGEPAPYNMTGAKVLQRRVESLNQGKPFANASSICRPPGIQWQHDLNMPFQIFQNSKYVEFVFEEYHGRWYIQLDPNIAPPAEKQYMGYSIGHWEGNTLVVETTNMKQGFYLDVDGTPLSRNGKLITRIRKIDDGQRRPFLEMETTIVDPTYYTEPWSVVRRFGWNPASFKEYNCEEQIGDPAGSAVAGFVFEPQD
ncbi:hypothetical protein [Nitrospirillum viridazoti]|nr:hypothetical protein [Nitrospirillum amazonense]